MKNAPQPPTPFKRLCREGRLSTDHFAGGNFSNADHRPPHGSQETQVRTLHWKRFLRCSSRCLRTAAATFNDARMTSAVFVAIAAMMLSTAAFAHPHMFVDAQSTLLVGADGRVTGVRTAMIIDPLTTQYVLEEHGLGPDAALTDADRQVIAEAMVGGLSEYDYFTEIRHDGELVAIADAAVGQVQIHGDLLAAALDLTFSEPLPLDGEPLEVALFDPTYFAAVKTLGPPIVPESVGACTVDFVRFEPQSLDAMMLLELDELSREETPADPRIGARFADRSRVECGA